MPGAPALKELIVWRLERSRHASTWQTGEGAFQVGGRWSSTGRRVIYTALDPATAILEVAVHKGFDALDTVAHKLLSIKLHEPAKIHVLDASTIANKNWLRPGAFSQNQQKHGDGLLSVHPFVIVPSVVSSHSWNLLIDVSTAGGAFELVHMEDFALDTRLAKP
ncbi:MAG: RES domain-containing protein [Hydrogenophaga sp.]|nr:RES domain-containing protein [Hydrogenophaga sp.]